METKSHYNLGGGGRLQLRPIGGHPATGKSEDIHKRPTLRKVSRGNNHVPSHEGGTNRGATLRGKILDFRGLGGPERPGNPSKRWGAKLPTFLRGFPAARGRLEPRNG